MAQYLFGAGKVFATPIQDVYGQPISNATPVEVGVMQSVSVDISYDLKELYGRGQFAVDAARGKGSIKEVAGQAAQTGAVVAGEGAKTAATSVGVFARIGLKIMETIKSIMMSAWEAMAKTMASIPFPVNIALGVAAFAGVAALVGKVASASGGYDIPAGVNPMTQLHEEEMVLPKQHANTIRALGKSMANGGFADPAAASGGGDTYHLSLGFVDTKGADRWLKKNGKAVANSLKGYSRNFGK